MLVWWFVFTTVFLLGKCEDEYLNIELKQDKQNLGKRYKPEWSDLDTRPLPEWYDSAKIGIFIHWGLYCVPGYGSEWFWDHWKGGNKNLIKFMAKNYPPGFTYQDFAPMFKAEFFNASNFAELFVKSGARYVVLTSKHHEGYTLFPSKRSFSWNSVDIGPNRDLVGELATAVKEKGLKFGVYHSLYEWFNPIYLEDKKANFSTHNYAETKLWPDLKQLVNDYQPSVIWSDGDWETYDTYWKSTDLLAWLYNDSPVKDHIVVNDRWGIGTYCKHGDFYNCQDRYNPGTLQDHKWENAFTLDRNSWGYRRNMVLEDVMDLHGLLEEIIITISCGGNVLINVGPTKEGTIAPIFAERLLGLGKWLKVNGEGIYGSSPWVSQNDTFNENVWYTCNKKEYNAVQPTAKPTQNDTVVAIYAYFLVWPKSNIISMVDITDHIRDTDWQINMLGHLDPLRWEVSEAETKVYLPNRSDVLDKPGPWALKFWPAPQSPQTLAPPVGEMANIALNTDVQPRVRSNLPGREGKEAGIIIGYHIADFDSYVRFLLNKY